MYLGPEKLLEKRKEYIMPCLGNFYKDPPQFVRGEMQYLFDHEGKKYLDFFAGVSVMNCGHSNPAILEPVITQLSSLQHTCNIYLTQPVADLAEKLAHILPDGIESSFFCNSGSEAMDGAMVLARTITLKRKFISLVGGLHGRTSLTMSATGIPMWRTDPFLTEDDFYFIDINGDYEKSLKTLEDLLKLYGNSIAGFIAEPIQGNAGIITPPDWYFESVHEILKSYDVLLIMDEVQTGFGRTGKMFACEHFDIIPDIIVYAKALGNGIPIAGFSTSKENASLFTKPSASTLGGNPVSCTAGLAVIDYIERNDLIAKSDALGEYLYDALVRLKNKYVCIADVRGKGLMLGIELVDCQCDPMASEVDVILERLKDNGVIIGRNGMARNVLAFQPPLVIGRDDIDFVIKELAAALEIVS